MQNGGMNMSYTGADCADACNKSNDTIDPRAERSFSIDLGADEYRGALACLKNNDSKNTPCLSDGGRSLVIVPLDFGAAPLAVLAAAPESPVRTHSAEESGRSIDRKPDDAAAERYRGAESGVHRKYEADTFGGEKTSKLDDGLHRLVRADGSSEYRMGNHMNELSAKTDAIGRLESVTAFVDGIKREIPLSLLSGLKAGDYSYGPPAGMKIPPDRALEGLPPGWMAGKTEQGNTWLTTREGSQIVFDKEGRLSRVYPPGVNRKAHIIKH